MMIYTPVEQNTRDLNSKVDQVADILFKRLYDIQVYLDYDFLRDMIYLCVSSTTSIALIKSEYFKGLASSPNLVDASKGDIYSLLVSFSLAIPLIITILALQYTSKRSEGLKIVHVTRRIQSGYISTTDKELIRACYSRIKDKRLTKKDLEAVIEYMSEA